MGVPFSADLGGFPMGKAVIEAWQAPIQLLPLFFLIMFSFYLISNKKSDLKLFAIKQFKQKPGPRRSAMGGEASPYLLNYRFLFVEYLWVNCLQITAEFVHAQSPEP